MGGLYLSSYGSNDGLVNEWSAKLPYGTHLFTDSKFDHDNIRKGSAVFSRIEPYLRTANVTMPTLVTSSASSNENIEQLNTTSNQNILGENYHKISGSNKLLRLIKGGRDSFYINSFFRCRRANDISKRKNVYK